MSNARTFFYSIVGLGVAGATAFLMQGNTKLSGAQAAYAATLIRSDTTDSADVIYYNATVITMNDAQPSAQAIAVRNGRILAVGSDDDVMKHQAKDTRVIDLQGKTVLPGFFDGHGHVCAMAVSMGEIDLSPPPVGSVTSIADIQNRLREYIQKQQPAEGAWIVGMGYDDANLKEKRHPTRADLDAVSITHPIVLRHTSGHLGTGNSLALRIAGITAETQNPQGGVIRREAGSQEPNGVLEESAYLHYFASGKHPPIPPPSERLNLVKAGLARYASYGITTAQEGATNDELWEGFIRPARDSGLMTIDVVMYETFPVSLAGNPPMQYDRHVRLGGTKFFLDGSPQGRTAWLTQPYFKVPDGLSADYRGYASMPDSAAYSGIKKSLDEKMQPIVHVNGDAAIDQLLEAIERSGYTPERDLRPVAVHSQVTRADQLDRMKRLGVMPSFFITHTYYWGDWHRDVVLGPERAANISPLRWAVDRDIKFTLHNDAPVVPPDVLRLVWSAVNRITTSGKVLGPDQRIPVMTALKAVTIWGAYQYHEEATKGSLEPGKLADMVILSENPLTVDPMKIVDIKVMETIKEGRSVYQRP